jgi:membrane associated rhomboid family serine protease
MLLLLLVVLVSFGIYVSTPEERARFIRAALEAVRQAPAAIQKLKQVAGGHPTEDDPFSIALRERTRWPIVTVTLAALNAMIFVAMVVAPGTLRDPETLVAWGASVGPHTTNGEWWRLLTSMFVHAGMLSLLVNIAGFVQLGLVLERLVGHLAFAAVYIAAGVLASLVSLSASSVTVTVGASGAVFGLYGLLFGSAVWGLINRTVLTIPLGVLRQLAPAGAIFILYSLATSSISSSAEFAGFATGAVFGLVVARGVTEQKPAAHWVGAAMAAAAILVIASAIPLRGVANVMPELERVVAFEERTAGSYETAVGQFRNGRMKADALARMIDQKIIPDLQAVRARLKSLERVPEEHQPLMASAEEYLRLRDASWRLRSEALNKSSMLTLRKADKMEWASLDALQKIKAVEQK